MFKLLLVKGLLLKMNFENCTYIIDAVKDKIKTLGRGIIYKNKLQLEMTASGFEIDLKCKGNIFINLVWSGEDGLLGVIINNDIDNMASLMVCNGNSSLKIAENLFEDRYNIKVVKLNEYCRNQIEINSISFCGELLQKPKDKELKLEFYGNSLTCGYGNLSKDRATPNPFCPLEHGYKTYAAFLANKLNAEISVAASSGFGLCYSYGGSTTDTVFSFWDMALPSKKVKWNFESYTAHIVFINLGTNDVNFAKNAQTKIEYDVFLKAATKLVEQIRSKNENCIIVFATGMLGELKNEFADLAKVYADIAKTYQKVYYFGDLYTNQLGGDWHSNVDDHLLAYEKLHTHLKNNKIINTDN